LSSRQVITDDKTKSEVPSGTLVWRVTIRNASATQLWLNDKHYVELTHALAEILRINPTEFGEHAEVLLKRERVW